MNDIKGVEIKAGQKVVYKAVSGLKTGIVERMRISRSRSAYRGNQEYEVCVILLDEPIRRYERGHYERDANGHYNYDNYIQGAERTAIRKAQVWGGNNVLILEKEDLTNAEKGVE